MRKIAFAAVAFCQLLFAACASSRPAGAVSSDITVTNTSVVSMTADCITFRVTVRERGDDSEKVTDAGNIKANRVKSILSSLGIDEVYTGNFTVMPNYAYIIIDKDGSVYDVRNEKKEFRYHEYLHTMTVRISDVNLRPDLAGRAIDAVMKVGNIEVGNVAYSVTDNRKANSAVRRMSAAAVMDKIRAYADGCGVKLKEIKSMREGNFTRDTGTVMAKAVSSNSFGAEEAVMYDMAPEAMYVEDSTTSITSDKVSLTAEVDYTAFLGADRKNTLNVRGFSEVKTEPDIADFTFTVRSTGQDTASIVRENAEKVRKVCLGLRGSCVMTTDYFAVKPYLVQERSSSSSYHDDRANEIRYYECRHTVRVSVRDFGEDDKLGKVIDAVKKCGAGISIGGISYRLSDNAAYTAEAREKAAANGREKCEIYASGAGAKYGGALSLYESRSTNDTEIDGDSLYYGKSAVKVYDGSEMTDGRTVIFTGRVSVRAQLTATVGI